MNVKIGLGRTFGICAVCSCELDASVSQIESNLIGPDSRFNLAITLDGSFEYSFCSLFIRTSSLRA